MEYNRLEWLGDAVLEVVTRLEILNRCKDYKDGHPRDIRNSLASNRQLEIACQACGLDQFLLCSPSTELRAVSKVRGDIYEAFCGALFLDLGMDFATVFIRHTLVTKHLPTILETKDWIPARARLRAFLQDTNRRLRARFNVEQTGTSPNQYTCKLTVAENPVCEETAASEKLATEKAAETALALLKSPRALLMYPWLPVNSVASQVTAPLFHNAKARPAGREQRI